METVADRIRARLKLADGEDIGVRPVLSEVKESSPGLVTAVANTAAVDLVDEVVVPEGVELDPSGQPMYLKDAKSIFYNHDSFLPPIGTFRNMRLTPKGIVAQFSLSKATQFAKDVGALIGEGAINGVSIGFIRLSGGQPTEDEVGKYGIHAYITRAWRWLELSVTPQPCNPEAWIMGAKSVPDDAFTEKVRKAAERRIVSRETVEMLGVARRKKIVIFC